MQAHERFVGTGRALVNRSRNELLARTRFPRDQHRGPRGSDLGDGLEHALHLSRLANDVLEAEALFEALLQVRRFSPEAHPLESPLESHHQLIHVEGFVR